MKASQRIYSEKLATLTVCFSKPRRQCDQLASGDATFSKTSCSERHSSFNQYAGFFLLSIKVSQKYPRVYLLSTFTCLNHPIVRKRLLSIFFFFKLVTLLTRWPTYPEVPFSFINPSVPDAHYSEHQDKPFSLQI